MNPIHFAGRTHFVTACGQNVPPMNLDTRQTRYPALVTCHKCIATFTHEDIRLASSQVTEPEGV